MSDAEKIKASKTKKETAGNKKKAEGQADFDKDMAEEMKFISRGSGEDSGIATREERRKAIKMQLKLKRRAGRKEAMKMLRKENSY
jgi:ABC-type tungstate transport system permease subunit